MQMPQVIPISDLRKRQAKVVEQLQERPVMLTQHGYGAAVLVTPEHWERLLDRLEELEDTVAALQAELALARGEDELVAWEPEADPISDTDQPRGQTTG